MAARGSLCLPHVRQTLAGSTKVLGRDEATKKPPECAVVASAVAFMGPKWRRPPVFYFSSMMVADTEKLVISTFHIHNFGIELYHSLSYAHLFLLSLVEYLHENHIMNHLLVIVFLLQKSATRHYNLQVPI